MSELVSTDVTGGVAVLTLQVPERRNVLSAPLVRAIAAALDAAEANDAVRCVVLTGAGKAFCAGAELDTLAAAADGEFDSVREVYEGFLRVLRSPLPTIAAVNGPAVGAGFNLALACDVRIAGASARFDTRFAELRLHPGGGHTWLLARAVGHEQAVRADLFGEIWDAETARARGLVSEVAADDELLATAVALGARLDDQEPEFVRRLTATLRAASDGRTDHAASLASETDTQQWSATQPAFLAGVRAIQERIAARR